MKAYNLKLALSKAHERCQKVSKSFKMKNFETPKVNVKEDKNNFCSFSFNNFSLNLNCTKKTQKHKISGVAIIILYQGKGLNSTNVKL